MRKVGISAISYYLPSERINNAERLAALGADERLLYDKIGMLHLSRKLPEEKTSFLAFNAAKQLLEQTNVHPDDIECLIVVTQNPDNFGLPHTSAILHAQLNLPETCAVFDVSLGCSGYVYGLSILQSFMENNGLKRGVLVTADPYSKIIDMQDKNTSLLFGDAATASLLEVDGQWQIGLCDLGTQGVEHEALYIDERRCLQMNGRAVFNFSAKKVPISIQNALTKNKLSLADIDKIILHQGSRYIVETIGERIGEKEKTPFLAGQYGNTVSSSIPLVLAKEKILDNCKRVLISGFGVGLSWATTILTKKA